MSITPQDVQSQQFNVRFRGFDVDEVDAFLERVAEELLLVLTENQQLKERLSTVSKDVETYKNQEKTFHNAIISTQKIADEILDRIKKEAKELKDTSISDAEKLLRTARQEAEDIRHRYNSEVSTLITEIDRLEQMKNQIRDELRNLLNSYLERLDQAGQQNSLAPQKNTETDNIQLPEDFNVPPPDNGEESAAGLDEKKWLQTDVIRSSADRDNLSDLYQKIDLHDVTPEASLGQSMTAAESGVDMLINDDHLAQDSTVPDLNDDLALSLNDPLDELETSVRISRDPRIFKR